jgi:hypothetical protein
MYFHPLSKCDDYILIYRYYELLEKDTLCFGESTREFVVLSDAATE